MKNSNLTSDNSEDKILLESAKIASSNAIRVSTALGLPIKVIRDNKIMMINPDKSEKVIKVLKKTNVDISGLKKGSILERK